MKSDSDELFEPYFPERYKELVRRKKQRRLLRKIGIAVIALIILIGVAVVVAGMLPGGTVPKTSPAPVSPVQTTATPVPETTAPVLPIQTATYAAATITPAPATKTVTETPEPVLTARAGTYLTPETASNPAITRKQAETLALAAFPDLPSGDMTVELANDADFGQVWKYTLRADTTIEASGMLDATTGTVLTFSRTIHAGGRSQNPVLTMASAREIADSTINNRNTGILSVNMSDDQYVPLVTPAGNVAGSYRFVYNRVVQDYPCDADGFVVGIDAVTGAITEYRQRWQTPDNAFMIAEEVEVPKYDATFTLQAKAKAIYPSSITSLRIISADIRWKDGHNPGTIPRPGTIPLAWKIVFDDDTIRAKAGAAPAVGWVDVQTGDLLDITYRH